MARGPNLADNAYHLVPSDHERYLRSIDSRRAAKIPTVKYGPRVVETDCIGRIVDNVPLVSCIRSDSVIHAISDKIQLSEKVAMHLDESARTATINNVTELFVSIV
jgi:hypothetical protein